VKAAAILEVDEIVCSSSRRLPALSNPYYTDLLAIDNGDEARMLVDENDDPIAVAFHEKSGWIAGSFLCRHPNTLP
jgi:hypothetical protein